MKFSAFSILLLVCILGAFLRFYKLDWGQGIFTHPDEYHIVISVNQLSFPNQMHPHFFSYGTGVIYPFFFAKEILQNVIPNVNVFLLGRVFSALFSTLTILIIYFLAKSFLKREWALLAAILTAVTPGLIQQAHFATPESTLTFFLLSTLLFTLRFVKNGNIVFLSVASVFLGLAMGVKITALLLFPALILGILMTLWSKKDRMIGALVLSPLLTFVTFIVTSPYVFLDYPAWRSSMNYESSVATGKLVVFYTRQFIDTTPILFQFEKILPFALGLGMFLAGMGGLIFLLIQSITRRKKEDILLLLAFLFLFIPHAFLFARWTRFLAPTFPFFALFTTLFLAWIAKKSNAVTALIGGIVLGTTILWMLAFLSIYLRSDIRMEASQWLESTAKPGDAFLIEGGNMIDVPLHGNYKKISLDFYNLEEDQTARQKIVDALSDSEYFLVQSRRIFLNHQRLPYLYPKTNTFYDGLFTGGLGFEKIAEITSYPQIGIGNLKIEIPDEQAEETWSVFDHPVIRVFKKNNQLAKEEYARFLEE